MQKNSNQERHIEEDEIDLRELFKTLSNNKRKIFFITTIITMLAIVYVFVVPKVFEAKAVVKIGEYKLNNNNNNNNKIADSIVYLDDASVLVKELEVLYIDILKNEKNRDSWIEKVSLLKQQKNIFELSAMGYSNDLAAAEVVKVLSYVKEKHIKVLNDLKDFREAQIKQASGKLELLKNKTLPSLVEKIKRYQDSIKLYEENFISVQSNLKKIKNSNPTLATIQINEQKYLADMLITLRDSLEEFENKKDTIEMVEITKLEEELNTLKSLMKPYNYKNTEVIGNIILNDYAVKPKKTLIVIVAFVTGLILSVFLVFFLEFIRGIRKEDE